MATDWDLGTMKISRGLARGACSVEAVNKLMNALYLCGD